MANKKYSGKSKSKKGDKAPRPRESKPGSLEGDLPTFWECLGKEPSSYSPYSYSDAVRYGTGGYMDRGEL